MTFAYKNLAIRAVHGMIGEWPTTREHRQLSASGTPKRESTTVMPPPEIHVGRRLSHPRAEQ